MLNSIQQLSLSTNPANIMGSFPNHRLQPIFGKALMAENFSHDISKLKDLVEEKEPQLRRYFQK